MMRFSTTAIRFLVSWMDRIAVIALLAMMMLTTSDVLLRKFVNKPLLGVSELVEFALGVAFFFAVPGVFARGGNIAVDMIDQWLPKCNRALTTLSAALAVVALVLLSWHMWKPMMDAISFGDTSSDLQILKIWFLAPAWVGIFLALVVSIFVLLRGELVLPATSPVGQGPL
jgi:TRAP-type transport system small permease protein